MGNEANGGGEEKEADSHGKGQVLTGHGNAHITEEQHDDDGLLDANGASRFRVFREVEEVESNEILFSKGVGDVHRAPFKVVGLFFDSSEKPKPLQGGEVLKKR